MRTAVITLNINYPGPIHWSRPLFMVYATKIGATYEEFCRPKINHPICPMLEKYQLYDTLAKYDRVIYFDADILVQPKTPNLFDIVPPDKIGAVYDVPNNDEHNKNRGRAISNIKHILGEIDWSDGYVNSGVLVLSKMHRNVFKLDPKLLKVQQRRFLEQSSANYNIRKNKFQIHRLPRSFNRIAFGGNENFFEGGRLAYVLHFAGRSRKTDLMKKFYPSILNGLTHKQEEYIERWRVFCIKNIKEEKTWNHGLKGKWWWGMTMEQFLGAVALKKFHR